MRNVAITTMHGAFKKIMGKISSLKSRRMKSLLPSDYCDLAVNRDFYSKHPLVVTFSGGMGAQILSAAIYFHFEDNGLPVFADFSYFQNSPRTAKEGEKGEVSFWCWELDCFGMQKLQFLEMDKDEKQRRSSCFYLEDGKEKGKMAISALCKWGVRARFPIPSVKLPFDPSECAFLCMHIRRGDYINVASHLVDEEDFIKIASSFAMLVRRIIVVSDSAVGDRFLDKLKSLYSQVECYPGLDIVQTHSIMRLSSILVCSNSQFSFSAAILNEKCLRIVPKRWFGGKDAGLEDNIDEKCQFQIVSI
jgi:hypothetical protein